MALQELLVEELQDLLHAEGQILKALPKMVKAAHEPKLKNALEKHRRETEGQVERLKKAFELLGARARAKMCNGMRGLIEEGQEVLAEGKEQDDDIADLGLIAAAQKVEHYEISGYGTAKAMANELGESEVAKLLSQTEEEEGNADKTLTEIAKPLLERVAEGSEDDEEEEEEDEEEVEA